MNEKFILTSENSFVEELKSKGCKVVNTYIKDGKTITVLTNNLPKDIANNFSNNKLVFTNKLTF